METRTKEIVLHPHFLDMLFACKSKTSSIFRDVLGLHEISHISISYVNHENQLLALSSTPALEFNLFSQSLWKFDKTYRSNWFALCTEAHWESLYVPHRYDELYYVKQIKHNYPLGISLATKLGEHQVIYSLASHKNCQNTRDTFAKEQASFYKIGQYCTNHLLPLFDNCDQTLAKILKSSGS